MSERVTVASTNPPAQAAPLGVAETKAPRSNALWDAYEVDTDAEDKGRWITIGGCRWCIRASDHPEVNNAMVKRQREQMRIAQANDGILPESIVQENLAFEASLVVTDWGDNVTITRDGDPVPFSRENAVKLFSTLSMKRLRSEILGTSRTHEFFRRAAIKALEGNSSGG